MLRTTLRHRLTWLLLQSFVLSLVVLVVLGVVGGRALRRQSERQRIDAASLMAASIDFELSAAAQDLAQLADESWGADPAVIAGRLRQYRFHSAFGTGVSLLDENGRMLASDPADTPRPALDVTQTSPGITRAYPEAAPSRVALLHTARRDGASRTVVAEMALVGSALGDRLREMAGGPERHVVLVDEEGVVLAASEPTCLLQRLGREAEVSDALAERRAKVGRATLHPVCSESRLPVMTVLAPLRGPHWGVVLQEQRVSAYATTAWIQRGIVLAAVVLVAGGLFLATALSRSIVAPLNALSARAARMRDGDLTTPVLAGGDHEIRLLGEVFEAMRERLHGTLARLEAFNESLEAEVQQRTRRLAERDAERRVLVRRLLTAGEDERCRLARELHDETAQMLTAVQLALDDEQDPDLDKARRLLVETQREIHRVIHDLRPTLLDDLGLRAAIRSHAETHLRPNGIDVSLEIDDLPPLEPAVEIAVFRVYQELATNVLRHADAERVSVELYVRAGRLVLALEDDGAGFEVGTPRSGAGITGMRERVELVGGEMTVDSEPGMGTHVVVEVPLQT